MQHGWRVAEPAGGLSEPDASHTVTRIAHAFIWSGSGALIDLPVPNTASSVNASTAMAVDDKGTVVGSFRQPGQSFQAAEWTCTLGSAAK